jgi:hypothetical protein
MSGTGKAMLMKDRFGLPVTCVSAGAAEDYVAAVDLLCRHGPASRHGWIAH